MDKMPTLVEFVAAGGKLPMVETIRRDVPKLGRNKECFCGSGMKYKKCCLLLERAIAQLEREQDTEEDMEVKDEE
ncbi:hypothetical protein LCGC14_1422600 [marine sediment metagenome]|uniref:Zinc chelation protein SecC n=1 Tax=marine sediment metagenome TaxID=412755 RepID=A0A0F9MSK5_9ZZZZ